MKVLSRKDYMNNLSKAYSVSPKNPSAEQILSVCPQLSVYEIRDKLAESDRNGTITCFAAPPVIGESSFQIITYTPEGLMVKGRESIMEINRYIGKVNDEHHICPENIPYMDRAMNYAKKNWPESLLNEDNWIGFVTFIVHDPRRYDKYGNSESNCIVYASLDRDLKNILKQTSKSVYEALNESIINMTFDRLEGSEFRGGYGNWPTHVCMLCGLENTISRCANCLERFHNDQSNVGWDIITPPKVVKLLSSNGVSCCKIVPTT